ncbi:hypothetical protein LCGC14_0488420 [marine sediment metagenome]|uniref:Uncharacterized protein n=1 Tax=marine sediment metagenome TaxID=412755 RepID=A0A0F9S736_9ZZZZ
MKSPIISRNKHDREVMRLQGTINSNLKRHDKEIDELTKRLDEFLPKLFKIKTGYDKAFRTYKLQVAFSDEFIYEGFVHGDSQEMIHILARQLSRSIEKELMTINFARFRSDDGAMK